MLTKKKIFETPWFSIIEHNYKKQIYYKISIPNSVMIFPLTKNNKIVLVEQFRPALNKKTLEFPAGGLEKKEKAINAAKRELFEETGYNSKNLYLLGEDYTILSNRSDASCHFYFAKDCVKNPKFQAEKGVKVKEFTINQFKLLISSHKLQQISGLAIVYLMNFNEFLKI